MKKLLMTLVASVAIAVSANAQVFVGGSVGFGSVKVAGNDSEVTYKIVPEVGYNFNKNWAIGLKIGYQKGACNLVDENIAQDVNTKVFTVAPYGRYTFVHSKYVNVFIDLGLGFASYTGCCRKPQRQALVCFSHRFRRLQDLQPEGRRQVKQQVRFGCRPEQPDLRSVL